MGRYAQAEGEFREYLRLEPDSVNACFCLGYALCHQRKFAEAETAYRKVIELKKDSPKAYFYLGLALWNQGKTAEAEGACRKVIELKNDSPEAYLNLGTALLQQGKTAEAITAYRKAVELNADFLEPYAGLAHALRSQGKIDEAESVFRKAIQITTGSALAHSRLAKVLSGEGKFMQATSEFAKVLVLDPNRPRSPGDYLLGYGAAVQASDGQGDAASLDATQCASYRKQALGWLRVVFLDAKARLESNPAEEAPKVFSDLLILKHLDELKPVRDEEALAKLTENEREEWRSFWHDVERVRKRSAPRGVIQDWLFLSGLIPYGGMDGARALAFQPIPHEAQLRPKAGDRVEINGRTLAWREQHTAEPFIDFEALCGPPAEYKLGYAVVYVHADAGRDDLVLRVGSDDQAILYLNGEEIYRRTQGRPYTLDEDEVQPLRLRKGTNVLVFKVVNETGPGPLGSLHLVTNDGAAAEGIEYRLTP